ncbi:MAG: hypothetical protein JW789_01130 [Candidatus Aenigmarchaeota archaeon]|nr:hypothetical protein [Candidatus Aenigmarchaeota archaeon]
MASYCLSSFRKIHCDDGIISACDRMNSMYGFSLDDIGDKMILDPSVMSKCANINNYTRFLSEYGMINMFDTLSEEGFSIEYPLESETRGSKLYFMPCKPGKSIQIMYQNSESRTECDMVAKIGGSWVIVEAKSGVNSFKVKDAFEKIYIFNKELGVDPGFILAVPNDHYIITKNNAANLFEERGGRIVTFPNSAQDFTDVAYRLVSHMKKKA